MVNIRTLARFAALMSNPRDLVLLMRVVRDVERDRARLSPRDAIARARERGARCEKRPRRARLRLKKVVLRLDLFLGENCYRRALLESSVDAGAAAEKIFLGLDVGKTGHAWLESDPDRQTFDVTFAV